MTISDILTKPAPTAEGALAISATLSRNLSGFRFPMHADEKQRAEAAKKIEAAVQAWNESGHTPLTAFPLAGLSANERQLLAERGICPAEISAQQAAVYLSDDGALSVLVNGEDHLRLRAEGKTVADALAKVTALERALAKTLTFAFDKTFGYLTADPADCGTALRFSAELFLPGLTLENALGEAAQQAARENFKLSGLYTEVSKDLPYLRLTNTVTLGVSEETLAKRLNGLIAEIGKAEALAEEEAVRRKENELKDSAFRAMGLLKYARLLSARETLAAAGALAFGMRQKWIPENKMLLANLLSAASGASVRAMTHKEDLGEEDERLWRAAVVRQLVMSNE